MDRDAIEYTRQHYDAHANKMSTVEALRSRSEGAALPLKQYHNSIKRELINAFSGGPGASLLDLACGRGGDIWKWLDADLAYVLGVDLSPGEVAEAARRFEEAKAKRQKGSSRGGGGKEALPRRRLVAEFRECSTLGLEPFSAEPPSSSCYSHSDPPPGEGEEKREEGEEKRKEGEEKREEGENGGDDDETSRRKRKSSDGGEENGQNKRGNKTRRQRRRRRRFDSVSCMFAAHYFCSSDAALSMFLSNVARNLRPGGFFFGTVPSGKKVMAAIKGGRWPLLATPMLRLEAKWQGPPQPFGCGYTCAIGNTVTSTAATAATATTAATEGEVETAAGRGGEEQQQKNKDEATEQGSFEYLVFASAFSAIAAKHGLSHFPRWGGGVGGSGGGGGGGGASSAAAKRNPAAATAAERLLDPADELSHFKSFAPHFPGSDPSLERASELFQAFVFVKDAEKEEKEDDFVEEEEEEGGGGEEDEEEEEKEEAGAEEADEEGEEGKTKKRKL